MRGDGVTGYVRVWGKGNNNNNNNSYITLYLVNIYELAVQYIINIKIHLTIKKAQVL